MANRPTAIKSIRQNARRRLRNKAAKSRLRTETNKLDRMLQRGEVSDAEDQFAVLTRLLQRAAARHIVHPNMAARKQAQYQKRVNELKAASA